MAQHKPDNKPPSSPKLLKFTGNTKTPDAEAKVVRVPEQLMDQALAIALFDAGAATRSSSAAQVSSIDSFSLPAGKRALKVREQKVDRQGNCQIEALHGKETDPEAVSSMPKPKKKSP